MTADNAANRPILLVEDDPSLTRLFALVIRQARITNSMIAVGRGADAIEYLLGGDARPAVVLLDLGLPDIDGLEVLASIRKRHDRNELPVIVLSGSVATNDVRRAMDAGANSFLAKPVAIAALIATLQDLGLQEPFRQASQPGSELAGQLA